MTRWRPGPSRGSWRQLNGAPFQTGTAWPPRSGPIPGAPWLSRSSRPFALSRPYGTTELLEAVVTRAPQAGHGFRTGYRGIRSTGSRRKIRPVEAGLRGSDRYLAVSPVDLRVREGRAFGSPDGTDAAGSASRLQDGFMISSDLLSASWPPLPGHNRKTLLPVGPLSWATSAGTAAEVTSMSAPRAASTGARERGSGCSICTDIRLGPRGAELAGCSVSPQQMRNGTRPPASALPVARHRSTTPEGPTRCPSPISPGS